MIVSSSPAETVEPIGEYLGVDDVIATRARIDAEGRYTGELEFYAYAAHKAEAIREMAVAEGIDLAGSYAYSDSITDLPMLELVGHPVAVNPDRELDAHRPANANGRCGTSSGPFGCATVSRCRRGARRSRRAASRSPRSSAARRVPLDAAPDRAGSGINERIVVRAYAERTFLAISAPRAMSTTSSSSFFMGRPPRTTGSPAR